MKNPPNSPFHGQNLPKLSIKTFHQNFPSKLSIKTFHQNFPLKNPN
jgi:hypothetical protein